MSIKKFIRFLFLTLEYDQILDDEHAKLLQTHSYPSEAQFIWNNVRAKEKSDLKMTFSLIEF